MEIKFWIFTGSLLIYSIILDTTNGYFLRSANQNSSNTDTEPSVNHSNATRIINDITITSTEPAEYVNINMDDIITKIPPPTTTEIIETVHDILDNVQNNSLTLATKTIMDNNLTYIENDQNLSKIEDEELSYGITTTIRTVIPPPTINIETITDPIIEENNIELFESSSLIRNLDEKIHKLQDKNSNIEIHELTATGSETLEDNIRNSVKEEISLDTAFETSALDALDDIPEPDVRKALAEDLLDGLSQKDIRNEEKIEDINMAKNMYIDEQVDNIETSSLRTTTEHLENLDYTQILKKLNEYSRVIEDITELPEIKLDPTTVINSQIKEDIKNNEAGHKQNLKFSIDDLIMTTPDSIILDELTTTNLIENLEKTTISIEKDSEFRQGREFDNKNTEKSLAENSNELRRLKNPYKTKNSDGLSHQAQKILNIEKNRSGRTFSENIINDNAVNSEVKNINNNQEINKNSNLDETIETTTVINIGRNLNIENNENSNDKSEEPLFSTNLEVSSTIHDNLNSENDVKEVNNLIETTTVKIEMRGENVSENELINNENLTENTILEEQLSIEDNINTEVEEIKGKNIEENLVENKENISNEEVSTENDFIQSSYSGKTINIEEANSEENNIQGKILEETITDDQISNKNINSEFVENDNEGISKNEINIETNTTNPLEQNSNSIEIEANQHEDVIIHGNIITETTTTAQIEEDLLEINENNISGNRIIDHISESVIDEKDELNRKLLQKNCNNCNTEHHQIEEEKHIDMDLYPENSQENMKIQLETKTETIFSLDEMTTTSIPIILGAITTEEMNSKQELIKKLNEEIQENENSAVENIELQQPIEKIKSSNSVSSESSQSSESISQITSSTTDSSSSQESTESSSTAENNLDTTTMINDNKDNKISKNDKVKNTESISSSSSEESSEEKIKKPKIPKLNIYDILSGNIQIDENLKDNNSNSKDLPSKDNLLENVAAKGRLLDITSSESKNEKLYINNNNLYPKLMPRQELNKEFPSKNHKHKKISDGLNKIFIQSDETAKIPSLIFETTTMLPLKIFNNSQNSSELFDTKRTFQHSEEILKILDNDTAALTETLIEAAELTTELSRHITSFRSIMEADTEIPNETHETITFSSIDTMASSNIGKALPNHGLKSDTNQSNASIVILICTTTVIMIIGLLAVTIYRYRGKHGTLDIQLEEQRRGKDDIDNDDDDDDSETISSLNNDNGSATQSLQSNEKDNITIQTNELSFLSKSNDESE